MNRKDSHSLTRALCWDIFCQVIDNYGDIGVCWRLCADLAERGHQVRLWVDDASPLEWMAPGALDPGTPNVRVLSWDQACNPTEFTELNLADVWIEAFGCNIPQDFVAYWAARVSASEQALQPPCWINLEYLSAEDYVERSHALPSPVMHGPGKGWTKYFYYPGFSEKTGGLLREPHLCMRRQNFDRWAWLAGLGISARHETLVSLFCYEPPALKKWLVKQQLSPTQTRILVTSGRATSWAISCLKDAQYFTLSEQTHGALSRLQNEVSTQVVHVYLGALTLSFLPPLTQLDFDHLLWSCDLNLVRGEDSLVRALWARVPFVWQIYEQADGAHVTKLMAFLQTIQADQNLARRHLWWNHVDESSNTDEKAQHDTNIVTEATSERCRTWAWTLSQRLSEQEDLVTTLLRFVHKNSKIPGFAE